MRQLFFKYWTTGNSTLWFLREKTSMISLDLYLGTITQPCMTQQARIHTENSGPAELKRQRSESRKAEAARIYRESTIKWGRYIGSREKGESQKLCRRFPMISWLKVKMYIPMARLPEALVTMESSYYEEHSDKSRIEILNIKQC